MIKAHLRKMLLHADVCRCFSSLREICMNLHTFPVQHISFTGSFLTTWTVSFIRDFFPPHRFVIYFELVLGGLSALVLTDHQWSMAKQHGRRCWCIWDLRRHLAEAVIKVKTLTGRIFPSATQRTSLLFVLKNWYYDGIWIVWKSDKDRGRPSEGENYSTHVSV